MAAIGIIATLGLAVAIAAMLLICSWAEDIKKIADLERRIEDLESKYMPIAHEN